MNSRLRGEDSSRAFPTGASVGSFATACVGVTCSPPSAMLKRLTCHPRSVAIAVSWTGIYPPLADGNSTTFNLSVTGRHGRVGGRPPPAFVAVGRLLKRRFGTRLGAVYQFFSAVFAAFLAVSFLRPDFIGTPGTRHGLGGPRSRGAGAAAGPVFLALVLRGTTQGPPSPNSSARSPVCSCSSSWWCSFCSSATMCGSPGCSRPSGGGRHHPRLRVAGFTREPSSLGLPCNSAGRSASGIGSWSIRSTRKPSRSIGVRPASSPPIRSNSTCPTSKSSVRPSSITMAAVPLHAMRLEVGIDYDTPPNQVKDVLVRATASVDASARGACSERVREKFR